MEAILAWGLELIRGVQTIASPGLTAAMKVLTLAGSEYFYLLLLPIVLWCVDERFGVRLALVVLFSAFVNTWLKALFRLPRPYETDPSVGLSSEDSFSLPSGHAQGSATLWTSLAPRFKKPWGLALALALPALIGFTRVYLGVHYPSDVLLGWILGYTIALSAAFFGFRLDSFVERASVRAQVIVAAALAFAMNALNMQETGIPGIFFGSAVGASFMFHRVRFVARGSLQQKILRLAIGLMGLSAIYLAGKALSPEKGESLYALARFVRYALLGVWASLGAPWLFVRLKIAESSPAAKA